MKLLNRIKYSLLACLMTLTACSDEPFFPSGEWEGNVPDELKMALVIPDPLLVKLGDSRDGDDSDFEVERINVLLFKANGDLIKNIPISTGFEVKSNIITVTTPLDPDAKTMQIVVNAPLGADNKCVADGKDDMSEVWTSGAQGNAPVFWGKANIDAAVTNPSIPLIRNTAKITVECAASNIEISQVGVYGLAKKGTISPVSIDATDANGMLSDKAPVLAASDYEFTDNVVLHTWPSGKKSFEMTDIYETVANPDASASDADHNFIRIIFKARYTDANGTSIEGWYVGAIRIRSEKQNGFSEVENDFSYGPYLPILRHHHYKITIDEVRSQGWPELEQAKTALPDNRATILVTDKVPEITDIEATSDYYLGVGADVVAAYSANAEIDIATSYPGLVQHPTWSDRLVLETDDPDWVQLDKITDEMVSETNDPGVKASKFHISVPLAPNTSPQRRYSWIKVRAGKLSRDITITQEGCPYSRRRKVTVEGMTKAGQPFSTNDYFSWLEGVVYDSDGNVTDGVVTEPVQGISRAANRGSNRIGLHFPVVPLYDNVTYTIPVMANDVPNGASLVSGSESFTLTKTASDYKVTIKNPTAIKSATGRLRIPITVDGQTLNVDYDLFRTGVIHYLEETDDQVSAERRSGWFYYDVVKIGNCYVLDRDLGAASNQAYAPGASDYKNNTAAIGGYFKANNHRSGNRDAATNQDKETVTHSLHLTAQTPDNGRFVPGTEADILSWNIQTGTVCSATVSSGRVSDGTVYFSKSGYYEGEEFKSQMHAMFWSRTYLGGTQGMSVSSPEYGYWYRYYDDMKSTDPEKRFSNIRIARGSNGNEPTAESVWRYMPLRLVWVDKNCVNATGVNNDNDNTVSGKMVIYFEDKNNWSDVYYHAWDLSDGTTSWGSLKKMSKVDGKGHLYRVELGTPTKEASGIMFATSAAGNDKTGEFKELYQRYKDGETVLYLTNGNNNSITCVDAGDQDIYSQITPEPEPEYKWAISFSTGGSQDMTQGSDRLWTLSKTTTSTNSTFFVQAKDKTTGAVVKSYYTNISSRNIDNGRPMSMVESATKETWIIPTTGTYDFVLDPSAKTITVTKQTAPVTDYDYKIKGSIWGDSNWSFSNKMTKEDGKYVLETTTTANGSFGIQRYTKGTETENGWLYGTSSTVEYDKPLNVVVEGQGVTGTNWANLPAGKYKFILDPVAMTLTIERDESQYTVYWARVKDGMNMDTFYVASYNGDGNVTSQSVSTRKTINGVVYNYVELGANFTYGKFLIKNPGVSTWDDSKSTFDFELSPSNFTDYSVTIKIDGHQDNDNNKKYTVSIVNGAP